MKQGSGFYRTVAALATPMILQNLITSALGMADIFMVGMLGELPMAGVTLANIPMFVVQLFIFGVMSGCTVLMGQYWGKGDLDAINRVMGIGFWMAGSVSLVMALVLFLIPEQFLSLFGNDQRVIDLAVEYGRIVGFSWFLNSFTMVYVAAFRSMERPKLGLYILVASMCCNTFLNWVFIFGKLGMPAFGIQGAAIGTLAARCLEVVIVAIHMLWGKHFQMQWKLIVRPGRRMVEDFIRYGGPVVLNETLWGLGTAVYPTIMGHMDGSAEILAAYAIVSNVDKICVVIGFGIAGTAAILVGREVGAGRGDGVYKMGQCLNCMGAISGVLIGIVMIIFANTIAVNWLFPLFHLSPGAQSIACMMITVQGVAMGVREFNSANIVGVLRGGGDVQWASIIDLAPLWLVAIPMALIASMVLELSILWVYLAMMSEQVSKGLFGLWRFRSGKWIHNITRTDTAI